MFVSLGKLIHIEEESKCSFSLFENVLQTNVHDCHDMKLISLLKERLLSFGPKETRKRQVGEVFSVISSLIMIFKRSSWFQSKCFLSLWWSEQLRSAGEAGCRLFIESNIIAFFLKCWDLKGSFLWQNLTHTHVHYTLLFKCFLSLNCILLLSRD